MTTGRTSITPYRQRVRTFRIQGEDVPSQTRDRGETADELEEALECSLETRELRLINKVTHPGQP